MTPAAGGGDQRIARGALSNAPAKAHSHKGFLIHPLTGLCPDYLDYLGDMIRLLEELPERAESLAAFRVWQPRSYCAHFADHPNHSVVIAAYQGADPATRESIDSLIDAINAILSASHEAIETNNTALAASMLARCAVAWLKPLATRASEIINGTARGAPRSLCRNWARGDIEHRSQLS